MIKQLIGFIYLLILPSSIFSIEYSNLKYGFKFILPSEWEQIPQEIVEDYADSIYEKTSQKVYYEAGFQLTETEEWFELPFIIMSVSESGKFTKKDIQDFAQLKLSDLQNELNKIENSLEIIFLDQPVYDDLNHRI